jgi:hypothetical protein
MSGEGKRGVGHRPQATAPILDPTFPEVRWRRLVGQVAARQRTFPEFLKNKENKRQSPRTGRIFVPHAGAPWTRDASRKDPKWGRGPAVQLADMMSFCRRLLLTC